MSQSHFTMSDWTSHWFGAAKERMMVILEHAVDQSLQAHGRAFPSQAGQEKPTDLAVQAFIAHHLIPDFVCRYCVESSDVLRPQDDASFASRITEFETRLAARMAEARATGQWGGRYWNAFLTNWNAIAESERKVIYLERALSTATQDAENLATYLMAVEADLTATREAIATLRSNLATREHEFARSLELAARLASLLESGMPQSREFSHRAEPKEVPSLEELDATRARLQGEFQQRRANVRGLTEGSAAKLDETRRKVTSLALDILQAVSNDENPLLAGGHWADDLANVIGRSRPRPPMPGPGPGTLNLDDAPQTKGQ
jgi:hypothetical protein